MSTVCTHTQAPYKTMLYNSCPNPYVLTGLSQTETRPKPMSAPKQLPEFVLFGDSLTEWSFRLSTQGFGLHLENQYVGEVRIVNEGSYFGPPYYAG
jgi:hypothetical protein